MPRSTPMPDDDLDKELRFHIDERTDDLIATGVAPDDARRQARLEFGGVSQSKEAIRDLDPRRFVDGFLQDVRFSLRSLRRSPLFSLTATLVLAVGIGANATVFTVVNTLLIKSLPFNRAGDIVAVRRRTPSGSSGSFPMHDYLALTSLGDTLKALSILDVFCGGRWTLLTDDAAEAISGCRVSADFFTVFELSAVRGRLFMPGDDDPARPLTAVITSAFWKGRFGNDPAIVGRQLAIGGQPYTVIGVAPDVIRTFGPADVYLSLPVPHASTSRTNSFQVIARIRPGVNRARAEAQVDAIGRRHARENPSLSNMPQGLALRSLQDDFVAPVRPALQALMVAVGLVLLIACANVANLVLARALSRRREIAVMAALGASRWRIARRVLVENVILAAAGGGAGLLVAYAGVRGLPMLSGANLPQIDRIGIDLNATLYVAATAALTGLAAGLPLALQLAGGDLVPWMKDNGARGGSGTAGHRMRMTLTVSQVALSTVLLAGAGLLARSFWNLASVDPGFQANGLLTMTVSMTAPKYPDSSRLASYTASITRRLERIPGVAAASSTTALPSEFPIDFPVSPVGSERAPATGSSPLDAWYRAIDPHFFSAMRIPVLSGRVTTDEDSTTGAPVVVISQRLARLAFPHGDALGQAVVIGEGYLTEPRDLRPRTIVGIVADTREQGLRFAPTPTMYVPGGAGARDDHAAGPRENTAAVGCPRKR